MSYYTLHKYFISLFRVWVWPHDDPRTPSFNEVDYEVARYAYLKVQAYSLIAKTFDSSTVLAVMVITYTVTVTTVQTCLLFVAFRHSYSTNYILVSGDSCIRCDC